MNCKILTLAGMLTASVGFSENPKEKFSNSIQTNCDFKFVDIDGNIVEVNTHKDEGFNESNLDFEHAVTSINKKIANTLEVKNLEGKGLIDSFTKMTGGFINRKTLVDVYAVKVTFEAEVPLETKLIGCLAQTANEKTVYGFCYETRSQSFE